MKKIEIILDNRTLILLDQDESNLEDYSKTISSLFVSGNVNIIQTSSEHVLVRPSKIVAIRVSEQSEVSKQKSKENEDTVTD